MISVSFKNLSRSCQNKPEGNDLAKFVPKTPGTIRLSTEGRCCFIVFYVLKGGTPEQDVDILNLTSRLTPSGVWQDDRKHDDNPNWDGCSVRKKRGVMDELARASNESMSDLKELTSSVSSFFGQAHKVRQVSRHRSA